MIVKIVSGGNINASFSKIGAIGGSLNQIVYVNMIGSNCMKCREVLCVHQHQDCCETQSTVGDMGLCDDFEEATEANESEQLSFNFGGINE